MPELKLILFIVVNFAGSSGTKIGHNDVNYTTGKNRETPTFPNEYENEESSKVKRKSADIIETEAGSSPLRLIDQWWNSVDWIENYFKIFLPSPQTSNGGKVELWKLN